MESNQFNSKFGEAGCHIENIGELLQQFDSEYVTTDGNINLNPEQVFRLLADLFNKFRETMQECEGKTIEIEFGDSATANLAEQLLKFILSYGVN